MDPTLPTIPLASLGLAFAPTLLLLAVLWRWSRGAGGALVANARMVVQLLAVGFVLTTIFETDRPVLILAVLATMLGLSAWIALRPVPDVRRRLYPAALVAIGVSGLGMLGIVTQGVLELPRWFEPRFVVPLAGMIFANAMNSVSLAAERYASECGRGSVATEARGVAMDAAMIPQINGLLAVGLVSLPGMMTGQILSGVEPGVAVRYQIMVMSMIFGSGGLAAAIYLWWQASDALADR